MPNLLGVRRRARPCPISVHGAVIHRVIEAAACEYQTIETRYAHRSR